MSLFSTINANRTLNRIRLKCINELFVFFSFLVMRDKSDLASKVDVSLGTCFSYLNI